MPESERPWYQNGFVMLVVAGVAFVAYVMFIAPRKDFVEIEVSGYVDRNQFDEQVLIVEVHHVFPGVLKRGRITAWAAGKPLGKLAKLRRHSFERWSPNVEHAVSFEFPIEPLDEPQPIEVFIEITAENAKETLFDMEWKGDKWSRGVRHLNVHE